MVSLYKKGDIMKYVRHFVQKTIKTDDPDEFDALVNGVYIEAAKGGKEPEIHFFDAKGFCASIKYFISLTLPESLAEEYEMRGLGEVCDACPYFTPITDKRCKRTICKKTEKTTWTGASACDIYYKEFREAKNGSN